MLFSYNSLGQVYDSYTKKGFKTIIVGDETNIIDEKYKTIKEKIIARTVLYDPDLELQISDFIYNRYKNILVDSFLKNYKNKLIDFIIALRINNLRTISFIIDNYIYALSKLGNNVRDEFNEFILKNIIIITNEYKLGKITIDSLDRRNDLVGFPNSYWTNKWSRERDKKTEESYLDYFYGKYITVPEFYNFKLIEELLDFILTGYLDTDKLQMEIKSKFSDDLASESEKVYKFLSQNLFEIEEDELIGKFDAFINFLQDGEYNALNLPYIYTFIKFIHEKNFISNWKYDIKQIINSALEKLINNDVIPAYSEPFLSNREYHKNGKDDYYNELCIKIKESSLLKKHKTDKEDITILFKQIVSDNQSYYEMLRNNRTLFQNIVNAKLESLFFELNNKGIKTIEMHIHNSILIISNAGEYLYAEKNALEKIITFIESNIDSYSQKLNHLRIVRLNVTVHGKDSKNSPFIKAFYRVSCF